MKTLLRSRFSLQLPSPAFSLFVAISLFTLSPALQAETLSTQLSMLQPVGTSMEVEEVQQQPQLPHTVDLTAPTNDLLVRIRNGFTMPNLNDELVLRHQQYYQNHPEYLRRMVERSSRYLYHIVDELEKRGMPMELALLPMVESAYNPMAYSRSHASGLWQFIPSTGKNFNLEQNWWQDQRRDIVASTSAALDYLQYIYELHGDWQLALASYNWGEGSVGRAIAKNEAKGLPTDYANLTMPTETRNYVPKLQALKNILGNPRLVAELKIPSVPNEAYFRTISSPAPIDVKLAAQLAGMEEMEFKALNPSHNRPVIQADTPLVIPADRVDSFRAKLASHEEPLSNWQTYAMQPGEKLEQLAPRFGITLDDLKRVNGLHQGKARLPAGLTLLVPAQGEGELDTMAVTRNPAVTEEPASSPNLHATSARYHIVKRGDTLLSIASKYDLTQAELKALNRIKGSRLKAGDQLIVAAASARDSSPKKTAEAVAVVEKRSAEKSEHSDRISAKKSDKAKMARYTVKKGDTLFSIAKRFNVEQGDIRRWNKLAGSSLKIGATLTIELDS